MDVVGYGHPRKRLSGEHAKALLSHKLKTSRFAKVMDRAMSYTIPDRLSLPYPSEDLYWLVLKKTGGSRRKA
jgi:hypothetical protein